MQNPKGNEYGRLPKYEIGDRVRVWRIFKNPIGTIEEIIDVHAFPMKLIVRYEYFAGGVYVEEFEESELTLFERKNTYYCNCKTSSERHSDWCNRYNGFRR